MSAKYIGKSPSPPPPIPQLIDSFARFASVFHVPNAQPPINWSLITNSTVIGRQLTIENRERCIVWFS